MTAMIETKPYRAAFAPRAGEPAALTSAREAAMARFEALGFPTRRLEAWRFTDVRPLQKRAFLPLVATKAAAPKLDALRLPEAAYRVVLVNGIFAPELSAIGNLPKGVWLAGTAETLRARPALADALLDATDTAGG